MLGKLLRVALVGTFALAVAPADSGEPQRVSPGARSKATAVTTARVHEAFSKLPLYFVENQGQVDARVAYYVQVRGRDTTAYFMSEGVTVALTGPAAPLSSDDTGHRAVAQPVGLRTHSDPEGARQRWAVKLDFVGARPEARPRGQEATQATVNYFKGPRDQWKTGLRTYASLVYPDLWPGIDLVFTGTAARLKYTFLIHPGADPDQIKLAYRGTTAVRLTGGGELDVSTPAGGFRDERPYVYQEVEGRRVEVAAAFALAPAGRGVQDYGFKLGPYDKTRPLVIDPTLDYSTYLGGAVPRGTAVDTLGNAHVTGNTSSAAFPTTPGAIQTARGGAQDAFVTKLNATGSALVYSTVSLPVSWTREGDIKIAPPPSIVDPDATVRVSPLDATYTPPLA